MALTGPAQAAGRLRRNFDAPSNQGELEGQLIGRGRYVEFNLLYDCGTFSGVRPAAS